MVSRASLGRFARTTRCWGRRSVSGAVCRGSRALAAPPACCLSLFDAAVAESKVQEEVGLTEAGDLRFRIDLVLYDAQSGDPVMVLDTKYKAPDTPSTEDIGKITAYAVSKKCSEAALIYPIALQTPLGTMMGESIHVRSLTYDIEHDLQGSGLGLLRHLGVMGQVQSDEQVGALMAVPARAPDATREASD